MREMKTVSPRGTSLYEMKSPPISDTLLKRARSFFIWAEITEFINFGIELESLGQWTVNAQWKLEPACAFSSVNPLKPFCRVKARQSIESFSTLVTLVTFSPLRVWVTNLLLQFVKQIAYYCDIRHLTSMRALQFS